MIYKRGAAVFQNPQGFIVLDGVNGAGKSTLQRRLLAFIQEQGFKALPTFEPGDSELGKSLRKILLENKGNPIHPDAETLLFAADRREHVAKIIEPALKRHEVVLSDRYYYSTAAFQGYGRGLNLEEVSKINEFAISGLYPDLVLLLDLDPLEGLKRNKKRTGSGEDSFEREELAFHERLRRGFLELAKNCREPFLVLDASRSADEVFEEARVVVGELLARIQAGR